MTKIFAKAFTLIELLIVIIIIGILVTAIIPRVKGIQAKTRDMARIAHIVQMQQALEVYRNENGKYPGSKHYASTLDPICRHAHPTMNVSDWTVVFDTNFQSNYVSSLPKDPLGDNPLYCYGYT